MVLDSQSLAVESIVGSSAQLLLHCVLGSIGAAGDGLTESGGDARGGKTTLEKHCVLFEEWRGLCSGMSLQDEMACRQ